MGSIQEYMNGLCGQEVNFDLFVNKGAGIIMTNNVGRYLVVLDNRSNMWSFPKGGMELIDENDYKKNAIRECLEETTLQHGLHYNILDCEPMCIGYRYFYATYNDGIPMPEVVKTNEVKTVKWMSVREIDSMQCSFDLNIWSGFMLGVRRYTTESILSFIRTKCSPSNLKANRKVKKPYRQPSKRVTAESDAVIIDCEIGTDSITEALKKVKLTTQKTQSR